MTETQEVVERVDKELRKALEHAEIYRENEKVRPSAIVAFNHVNEARKALDEIDERDFNNE